MIDITLSTDLGPVILLGVLTLEDVSAAERSHELDAAIAETESRIRASADTGHTVPAVRTMYKRLGIDPTKRRPSSEALLRRVRGGERLPRIAAVVDICNWCSLETQLPFGLYDLDRIDGPIEVRVGRAGEAYAGIRKDDVHVEGRPVLADRLGPFGNPSSDSARTMVTPQTGRVLVAMFVPSEGGDKAASAALELTAQRMAALGVARETGRAIVRAQSP